MHERSGSGKPFRRSPVFRTARKGRTLGPMPTNGKEAGPGSSRPTLIRAIGRWALTAAVITSVIGSGGLSRPTALPGFAGAWSPLTVLIAGAWFAVIFRYFAEVGSRFDQAGRPYFDTCEAYGPTFGF